MRSLKRSATLVILDGWGIGEPVGSNAYHAARTPNLDGLLARYPHATIDCSGREVGLPEGQMGNSEVGHLNLGAGRIVDQDITRIDKAVESGSLLEREALRDLVDGTRERGARLHLVGLVSDGGVHSSFEHLKALIAGIAEREVPLRLHALLDGRDTPPRSGAGYIEQLETWARGEGLSEEAFAIASVGGRYWGMDRDNRWDRVEKHWRCIALGAGPTATDPRAAIRASYDLEKGDEFVEPTVIVDASNRPVGKPDDGDSVFIFNFRADRVRELTMALGNTEFDRFDRNGAPAIELATMTEYRADFGFPVAFPPNRMEGIFADVLARRRLSNLRIAETEKYAHVTFFFNGGVETPWPGEERILIDSPRVATYDLQPEMSLPEVSRALVEKIEERRFDFHVANFANCDMVGHTGVLAAGIAAVEAVDEAIGRVVEAALANDGFLLITADHGNVERMWNDEENCPWTAHTTNPAHIILVDPEYRGGLKSGRLADVIPTLLNHAGIPASREMSGTDLRTPAE